tara:strand:+ start:14056 stop:16116 length:2061 start_codon:yes stop_codon:yes gene_type:complete
MRLIIVLLSLLIFNKVACQETAKIQVITRSLEDRILLRWAVDQPYEWQQANTYGFLINRTTITRNGEPVIPMERKTLTSEPLKPRPLEEWETLAKKNQNAAVVAQALYGEYFEVDVPGSARGKIMAINRELEQRFTFALVAVDQSFETAKLAGWALEDLSVKKGESYLYKISVALPENSGIIIKEGAADASPDYYQSLPKPIGLVAAFNDKSVLLNWDFGSLQHIYISYLVERSEDKNNFNQLNGQPLFKADSDHEKSAPSIYYTDSIVNNKKYFYRVRGISSFGETGPPSEIIEGVGSDAVKFTPRIYKKEIPDDNTAILFWEFPEEANEKINGFEIRRSNKPDGLYETVLSDIPPNTRRATFKNLKRINYLTVVAKAKNSTESVSYATIVQPVDSTPPSSPKGLYGVADTTGLITLSWINNIEDDLSGYRIYRSNNPASEFSEVTSEDHKENTFVDTLKLNLNKEVFYKIKAMDQRFNASVFSEVLELELPVLVQPSPPVIKTYQVSNDSVKIAWIPSSSDEVVLHALYRKNLDNLESSWELIGEIEPEKEQLFLDVDEKARGTYGYTITAKTKFGLESNPSDPIQINYSGNYIDSGITKFDGSTNRELRFISLTWKIKNMEVSEYLLYKGIKGENLKLFKTIDGKRTNYSDYELEVNSEYNYGLIAITSSGIRSKMQNTKVVY